MAEILRCSPQLVNKEIQPNDSQEIKSIKIQAERQTTKIEILKENTKKNIDKRHSMKNDLINSYEMIKKIRSDISSRITVNYVKDFLELFIKNNFLESQNIQLLLNLQLQSRTIVDLKSMIFRQQQFINENCLNQKSENEKMKLLGDTHEFQLIGFKEANVNINHNENVLKIKNPFIDQNEEITTNNNTKEDSKENQKSIKEENTNLNPNENQEIEINQKNNASDLISIQGLAVIKSSDPKNLEIHSQKGKIIKKIQSKENKFKVDNKTQAADLSIMVN